MELVSESKMFDGYQRKYTHHSIFNNCQMQFSVYLPPEAKTKRVPALYWLSGLTCTDDNFVQKSGAQRFASRHGIALVAPDTSPRGDNVADDPAGSWDFGLGAGFYVNATEQPWKKHYNMYDYVLTELPSLINSSLPIDSSKQSIAGHSMGGHGALILALRNPAKYKAVSAFAPICSPINCPWGVKAFSHYLGDDIEKWKPYDACHLIRQASDKKFELLIDQGLADNFLLEQLKLGLLKEACAENNYPLTFRFREGYDHSYNFIATFIEDHIQFHAMKLKSF